LKYCIGIRHIDCPFMAKARNFGGDSRLNVILRSLLFQN
jgi:hypothetical protein